MYLDGFELLETLFLSISLSLALQRTTLCFKLLSGQVHRYIYIYGYTQLILIFSCVFGTHFQPHTHALFYSLPTECRAYSRHYFHLLRCRAKVKWVAWQLTQAKPHKLWMLVALEHSLF